MALFEEGPRARRVPLDGGAGAAARPDDLRAALCARVGRDLTAAEWATFAGGRGAPAHLPSASEPSPAGGAPMW